MAQFNLLQCDIAAGNTGISKCVRALLVGRGGFFVPKGDGIPASAMTDLKAFLAGKVHNNIYAQRWHPVGPWVDITLQDEEEVLQTFANGSKVKNRDAYYSTRFRHNNGLCFHVNLRKFAGRQEQFDFIEVDALNNFIGTQSMTVGATPVVQLGGFDLSRIDVPNLTKATFAEAAGYWLDLDYGDATQLNDNPMQLAAVDAQGKSFDPLGYAQGQAVKDVNISNVTPSGAGAGVFTIFLAEGCNDISLGQMFGSTLTAALLVVTNAQTGAPITITSLAPSTLQGIPYVLTLDTTDPDYPVTGNIAIKLASVSTVSGVLVGSYYESNTLLVPRS